METISLHPHLHNFDSPLSLFSKEISHSLFHLLIDATYQIFLHCFWTTFVTRTVFCWLTNLYNIEYFCVTLPLEMALITIIKQSSSLSGFYICIPIYICFSIHLVLLTTQEWVVLLRRPQNYISLFVISNFIF